MSNIFAQMNPTALIAVAALLLLSIIGAVVLRLIRKGRAKNPGDLMQIARERSAAAKETKAATKRAEAAIAEPMTSSRLSRISAKGMADASAARPEVVDDPAHEESVHDSDSDDAMPAAEAPEDAVFEPAAEDAPAAVVEARDETDFNETDVEECPEAGDDTAEGAEAIAIVATIDLADPEQHPADWEGLLTIIERLDAILAQPWHDNTLAGGVQLRLSAARAAAGDAADTDPTVRARARDVAAIDLARTINNAAREQAAEIVAAVREFAHQQVFSPEDCAAVLRAMQQIEWMALIARDDRLEKRTLPLTRHDPDAPLWVADAWRDLRAAEERSAA